MYYYIYIRYNKGLVIMKKISLKKYFLYSMISSLQILKAYSTDSTNLSDEAENKITGTPLVQTVSNKGLSTQVLENFKQNELLIKNYLSSVKEGQLHFFWTRGYTFNDTLEYNPNKTVNIGGTEYKDKFFPYITQLLKYSPDNLVIKLIIDKMTMASNKDSIETLQNLYEKRFQISFINDVQERLLNHFADNSSKERINDIFKNATAGTPVLASDIYRVIGMIYGHDQTFKPNEVLYTYSDIDVFCHSMEVKSDQNELLIKSLFASSVDTQSAFYMGRSRKNNDIIKLRVADIDKYNDFCIKTLHRINTKNSVIDHFTKLHQQIRSFEENTNQTNREMYVPERIDNLIDTVMQATGPNFLRGDHVKSDLTYPSKTAGAWYAPEDILDYTYSRYYMANPNNIFLWDMSDYKPEQKKIAQAFTNRCDSYLKFIATAFYAKPFGVNHPFNVALHKHLRDNFPYHSTEFTDILRMSYQKMHPDKQKDYKLEIFKKGTDISSSKVYLEKNNDDTLSYTLLSPDKKIIKGTIDVMIEGTLKSFSLLEKRKLILEKISEQGYKREMLKGLTYDQWKKKSDKLLYDGLESGNVNRKRHYARLIHVLAQLDIELPLIQIPSEATLSDL